VNGTDEPRLTVAGHPMRTLVDQTADEIVTG
jgi:hypothetical protein